MRCKRTIIVGAFAWFFSMHAASGQDLVVAHICSFDISTFVPIKASNVDEECVEKWTITDEVKVAKLTKLFERAPEMNFDGENVRVNVVIKAEKYFIDWHGVVKSGSRFYKVDKKKFNEFRNSLRTEEIESPQ